MSYSLIELTKDLDVVIQGDPACRIHGVATLNQAQAGELAFLSNPLYKKYLPATQASAVILSPEDAKNCLVNALVCKNPYFVYARIALFFEKKIKPEPGIHPTVVMGKNCLIDPSASIGPHCTLGEAVKIEAKAIIGPGCVIGDHCEIGEGTELHAKVILYHQVLIGKRVLIASGTVVGSDGFGFSKHQGVWHKVPQIGRVVVEDEVEIGANCAIDRGAIEDTVIEKGVKLDNLIQVGHNVRIGEHSAIAGCVGIAGSAIIGKHCLIGGGAGIGGHTRIVDNAAITGMTAVTKSIREPGIYSSGVGGLVTNQEWRKHSARVHQLARLIERVKHLEEALSKFMGETSS
ncbi:MAG TPA: UDP-3-O-(3-hydroxymyristoyl)glucosamine N-acyltransferase [Gammaproteobacteria bacterium]|nr:UDP-3-O-(3-hydroxymyristoyl)glucosamine N-acyltransferase [Gammaproteobacteria bacterium]